MNVYNAFQDENLQPMAHDDGSQDGNATSVRAKGISLMIDTK
jgi:hypothetical protein